MTRRSILFCLGGFAGLVIVIVAGLLLRFATPLMVLEDMVVADGPSYLKGFVDEPVKITRFVTLGDGIIAVDTYVDVDGYRGDLVLVPGFSPAGKDDLRLAALAKTFARAGFQVHVPDLPGSRSLMVSMDDVEGLIATVEQRVPQSGEAVPLGFAAVSYAAGPAIAAAADPRIADRVDYVVALGGYHDAVGVVTYLTTGAHRKTGESEWAWGEGNPRAGWMFMAANAGRWPDLAERSILLEVARQKAEAPDRRLGDLDNHLGVDAMALVALFDNRDPDIVPGLIQAVPPDILRSLVELSPATMDLSPLSGELLLVHGLDDTVVPYTQSLNLGEQVPGTDIYLVASFTHVDPSDVDLDGHLTMMMAVDAILSRGLGRERLP